MDTSRYNENRLTDTAEDVVDKVTDKWSKLSGRTKKIIAGGTAAATLGGGALGMLASDHQEELSPEQLQSGQLDFDKGDRPMMDGGKPALMNYFDADTPAEQQVLKVSLASHLPESFQRGNPQGDYLDTVVNRAQSHTYRTEIYYVTECHTVNDQQQCHQEMRTRQVRDNHYYTYDLEIDEDFKPVNSTQEQKVREYFREFERLTGIKVEVTRDAEDAHITIANYHNEPDWYRGSLDDVDPDVIATYPEGASSRHGPSLQRNLIVMNDRNWGEENDLMDQIGRPLGFEDGKVNIATLRESLERMGFPIAPLQTQNNEYQLENGVKLSAMLPDNIIIDNGGRDTLQGSPENDTLVSDAGYCGRIDTPTNKLTNVFGNGKQYCIAEGEFELVRAGAGDDLIIAPRGGAQTIEPGAGDDRIAFFQPQIADVTILAAAGETGENTLYLHDQNVARGEITASGEGADIQLNFNAFSGRDVGRITLPDQLNGGGIDRVVVVDSKGEVVFEKDVDGLETAEDWQKELVDPMEREVSDRSMKGAQEEAARWRNNVRRRRDEIDLDDGGIGF